MALKQRDHQIGKYFFLVLNFSVRHKLQKIVFCDSFHVTCSILLCSREQNIWSKVKKSSKIGQAQKILISTFASFSNAITKV